MLEQQLFVIESHQFQNGGVQVVDMDPVFNSMQPEFVGLADDLAPLDAATRQLH